MTPHWKTRFWIAVLAIGLAGCSGVDDLLGTSKRAPDEFLVYSRKPLSIPPNYQLRPPSSNTGEAAGNEPIYEARDALTGQGPGRLAETGTVAAVDPDSPGTMALLERTGGLTADPTIKSQINRETTILAEADQSFVERLMFWGTPSAYGTVVDPGEESRRIRENASLGKPVTDGKTPTIARKKRALLEGIFN